MSDTVPPVCGISTAALADASVRLSLPLRMAPPSIQPLLRGMPFSGPAAPVTHAGSVDAFLHVLEDAEPGAVLVVDNGGRDDEACVGDLIALELREAGFAGAVLWGRHRDTAQLMRIGLPIWSTGACPAGPRRSPPAGPPMRSATLGGAPVSGGDLVVADDDGILFVAPDGRAEVLELASRIQDTESAQAERMAAGTSLRDQLGFADYRARQATDPTLTLRRHLLERGGAVET